MMSDRKWNANNPIGTQFHQVKPSRLLLPAQRDVELSFSSNNFPSIIKNIHAIKSLANPQKSHEMVSVLVNESSPLSAIKLTHQLFIVSSSSFLTYTTFSIFFKDNKNTSEPKDDNNEFTINNWLVPTTNKPYLHEIKTTHHVQHLPAYDIRGNLIHPSKYEEKLAGVITHICFTIVHYVIK
jgi:hypothetical protein